MGRVDDAADPPRDQCDQDSPSVGLVAEPQVSAPATTSSSPGKTAATSPTLPQIYYADLTSGIYPADSAAYLGDTGSAGDLDRPPGSRRVLAVGRAQRRVLARRPLLDVEPGADERDRRPLRDFAAGRASDMTTPSVALYNDVPAADDNDGLVATGNGAAWLTADPMPAGAKSPSQARSAAASHVLTSSMLPNGYTNRALRARGRARRRAATTPSSVCTATR